MFKKLRAWLLGILAEALLPHLEELRAIRRALEGKPEQIDYMPKFVGGTGPLEPFGPIKGTRIF